MTRKQRIAKLRKRIGELRRKLARIIRRQKRPHPEPHYLTMFDSVTPDEIPAVAEAVAGYVGGQWPTYKGLLVSHPHAKHLSIAVSAVESADCLDVEKGDATIAQAPPWLQSPKAKSANTTKPVLYTSVSQAQELINACAKAGIPRSGYLLWTAHYTQTPHLCGPDCYPGFNSHADATQYGNKALGRNLDVSLVRAAGFFRP